MVLEKVREHSNGTMDKYMKEIGSREKKAGKEYGLLKLIVIMVIGIAIGNKVMEFTSMQIVFTKENSKTF